MSLQDCVRLYQALQRLPNIVAALTAYDGCHTSLVRDALATPLSELLADCEKLVQMVETTVDLELVGHHEFVIKPSFDERLQGELVSIRGEGSVMCGLSRVAGGDGCSGGEDACGAVPGGW